MSHRVAQHVKFSHPIVRLREPPPKCRKSEVRPGPGVRQRRCNGSRKLKNRKALQQSPHKHSIDTSWARRKKGGDKARVRESLVGPPQETSDCRHSVHRLIGSSQDCPLWTNRRPGNTDNLMVKSEPCEKVYRHETMYNYIYT